MRQAAFTIVGESGFATFFNMIIVSFRKSAIFEA